VSAVPWKVQQYCYFWIASRVVTASEITELLGVAPDRVSVLGSKRSAPTPVPVEHTWELRCERHARVDEQASEVLRRIEPVADKVRSLTNREDTHAGLMMVRYFDDEEGGYGAMSWSLAPVQIALLARMGASIDADDYAGDFTAHQP
jgi:hypothetical protein